MFAFLRKIKIFKQLCVIFIFFLKYKLDLGVTFPDTLLSVK